MKQTISKNYLQAQMIAVTLLLLPQTVAAQGTFSATLTSHIKPTKFEDLLVAILEVFIIIATPIIVLYIIYAGFLYVTARGNTQQVEQATRALTYAVIGGVIVLGAVAISSIISGVVSSFLAP
jgi:hypothetical protein